MAEIPEGDGLVKERRDKTVPCFVDPADCCKCRVELALGLGSVISARLWLGRLEASEDRRRRVLWGGAP